MSITSNDVRNLIKKVNKARGFEEVQWNTVGAIHLYKDICGFAIDEVMNESGGTTHLVGGGLTKSEAYYYLLGLDK